MVGQRAAHEVGAGLQVHRRADGRPRLRGRRLAERLGLLVGVLRRDLDLEVVGQPADVAGDQLDLAGGHGDVLRGDRVLVERDPHDGLVLADRVVVRAPRRERDRGREEGAEEGAPGGELHRRHHL